MSSSELLTFPAGFRWGISTSAYQIEGAVNEDGRGSSIWDSFCRQPGKIQRGDTADVAADHYHRWTQDVQIMADLGIKAYRFSIAWPRILPQGKGQVNRAGLDFYERLVEALMTAGIEPFPTLYHWDLPQALQDEGGWPNRDTAYRFADYAHVVARRLGDRVTCWITHNEPAVAAFAGYFAGEHAPGVQDPVAALQTAHHLLLSHGLAAQSIRTTASRKPRLGIALNLSPVHSASHREEDLQAAARCDGLANRFFLDPLFRAQYPAEVRDSLGDLFPPVMPGDLQCISSPLDFLGVNYYTRTVVQHDADSPVIQARDVKPEGSQYSLMWEIYPSGMHEILARVWKDYQPAQILVTESGIPVVDVLDPAGRVQDEQRIQYLRDHLAEVHRAMADGVPVQGYFVWSLLDNFEWAYGYSMRFGLVYVDYKTQKRTVKDSGRWYARVIAENRVSGET